MEFLRRIIRQVKTQLKGLNTTEWLVLILLLVIFCGAIYMVVPYVAQREMVPLLDQPFPEKTRNQIIMKLKGWNETYQEKGDRIYVPDSKRDDLIALLAYEKLLPSDTSVGFMSLLKDKGNIWMPESERENRQKIILQMELARALTKFPVIETAEVFINVDNKLSINRMGPAASASVSVETDGGVFSKRNLASTIAFFVSGANPRMGPEDVKVIIDQEWVAVAAEGQDYSAQYMEDKVAADNYYRKKIRDLLPQDLDIRLGVDVTLDNAKTRTQTKKAAEEGEGTVVVTKESESKEHTSLNASGENEPGLVANASEPVTTTPGNQQQDTTNDIRTMKEVLPGYTMTDVETAFGGIKKITATIRYPLSYFESYAKSKYNVTNQPTTQQIDQACQELIPSIREAALGAIGLAGAGPDIEKQVVVNSFWAQGTTSIAGSGPGGTGNGAVPGGGSFVGLARHYAKHIAVTALAMISLFMVLMMVRKASGPVDLTEEEAVTLVAGPKPMDAFGMEESNIVDGEDPGGLLAGVELDDRSVRSRQVLQQVRDLVREEPEVAATLLGKWLKNNS